MTARWSMLIPAGAVVAFAAVLLAVSLSRRAVDTAPCPRACPMEAPARIVSLAPSITETLFALGLGDRVVGVTRYCDYPAAAASRTKVGGFEDVSFEAIATLKPDLIVLLDAHRDVSSRFSAMGWRVLSVRHETLEGILDSIELLGRVCGAGESAAALADSLHRRMDAVRDTVAGRPRPRVLMTLGGAIGEEGAGQIYIVGRGVFYESLLDLAGGRNAYDGPLIFPSISIEGVLHMNPDVIVCLAANASELEGGRDGVLRRWRTFGGIKAVRDGAVTVLAGGHVTVPGPRFVETLSDLARALHPDAAWDAASGIPEDAAHE